MTANQPEYRLTAALHPLILYNKYNNPAKGIHLIALFLCVYLELLRFYAIFINLLYLTRNRQPQQTTEKIMFKSLQSTIFCFAAVILAIVLIASSCSDNKKKAEFDTMIEA